jgi:hypothetical protein
VEFTRVTAPLGGRVGRHLVDGELVGGVASAMLSPRSWRSIPSIATDADEQAFPVLAPGAVRARELARRTTSSRSASPTKRAFLQGLDDFVDNQLTRHGR